MLEARGMVTLGGSKWEVAGGYSCSSKVLFLDLEGGHTDIFTFLEIPSCSTLIIVFCMNSLIKMY